MFSSRIVASLSSLVIALVEALISLRIVLKLLGANAATPFVAWVYETSRPLLAPFEGMFPSPRLSGGFIIEISSLFALIVYAFLGYLLEEITKNLENHSRRSRG